MTAAAKEMVQKFFEVSRCRKSITIIVQMIFANDFSDFHGISPIQASTKKMN